MKSFWYKSKWILRVYSAKVWLSLRRFLFVCISLLVTYFINTLNIFRNFFETEALHASIFSLSLVAANQVRVENLRWLVVHWAWYKELVMEQRYVLDLIFKIHKNSVLKILSLQECFSVYWAIKEPLETQIPHHVFDILPWEKVLVEINGEVIHDTLKGFELVRFNFFFIHSCNASVKHTKIHMVSFKNFFKQLWIFLLE